MKKILLIFGLLCMFVMVTKAQNCPFNVKFTVTDATCFNNGKIAYWLEDDDGVIIPVNGLESKGLSNVRIYTKVNETDSTHYSGMFYKGGVDTFIVDHGTYIVGVEGACDDGHGGFIKVHVDTVLTINTTYVVPEISAFIIYDSTGTQMGKHPTLDCAELGRVQLCITNGRFPYRIQVMEHGSSSVYRTLFYNNHQYNGSDDRRYDYRDYYSVEDLPEGEWDFYMEDGCNYGLPRVGQSVEVVQFPYLDYVEVYASSGNFSDSNVVKVNAVINSPYDYYTEMIYDYVQYRFTYEGLPASPWRNFPTLSSSNKVTLYDTIAGVHDYCDIWNKTIELEYKIEGAPGCNDTTIKRSFKYYKPNESKFRKEIVTNDSVVGYLCREIRYWRQEAYSINYPEYSTSYANRGADHGTYRYHYTHPLTWVYKDASSNEVIKQDTVSAINVKSYLFASEVEEKYGPLPRTINVTRTLLDGHGCIVYEATDQLNFFFQQDTSSTKWEIKKEGNDHCCNVLRSVSVKGTYNAQVDADGTVIRLVRSPRNNRYNFVAVYHSNTSTWTITKSNLQNMALINGASDGRSIELKDYCLPSGPYEFSIQSPCDTVTVSQNVSFPDIYTSELVENPEKIIDKNCTDWYVTYTRGTVARVSYNTDSHTGEDKTPVVLNLDTRFQVVDGPVGGYDSHGYQLHEPIRFSIPGTYVVKIYPNTSIELCDRPAFYDTIKFNSTTVKHVYAYAILCNSNDATGNVFVKGENGTEPYTYTLYSEPNKEGEILEVNSSGIFFDIPMRTDAALSCLIEDACGAYFHVNFFPQLLADLQITWFEGGLKATETCEGSTITVHTLQSDNLQEFLWDGPNGFHSQSAEPFIFIPRGADDGWYKVQVLEMGCQLDVKDSIYLSVKPSPSVTILQNTTICPGEKVYLTFQPHSAYAPVDVRFSIVYKTQEGQEIREYVAPAESSIIDSFTTTIPAKIFPYTIQDNECGYDLADAGDTTYISISSNTINTCNIFTNHDFVCHNGDAHLMATSSVEPPYTIRWYSDKEKNHLLKEETVTSSGYWSTYDTLEILEQTLLYVSVERENYCPSVLEIPTNVINLQDERVDSVHCDQVFKVYDSGGKDGDYSQDEFIKHTFVSTDGRQLALRVLDWNLSNTSHLVVISGTELELDSVLYELSGISYIPDIIFSRGNAMTLYFMSGVLTDEGMELLVEPVPGIAIADVYPPTNTRLYDEVCQSQSLTYSNPKLAPDLADVVSQEELNKAIKRAGTHIFTRTYPGQDQNGCDSVVTFVLTVDAPPFVDTTVVTTNFELNGTTYVWHGHEYSETGRYSIIDTLADGCDSLEILNLIILLIDTTDNVICEGDNTTMGIEVVTPRLKWTEGEIPAVKAPGDVLCSDGSILRPDSFLLTSKKAIGIVYYLDRTGEHGKAIALIDAPTSLAYSDGDDYQQIHSRQYAEQKDVLFDMDGMGNTLLIMDDATKNGRDFEHSAPAAYYCYYYNALSKLVEPNNPTGWYLPSMGELNLLFGNRVVVNDALEKIEARSGTKVLNKNKTYYLSSSEQSNSKCWHNDYSGHFATHVKSEKHVVRPSISF
ncbi:MAG: hypothetical protein J6X01_04685 [Bacteroidales bacterium]|nr:hypothetical protein [Bacteroidales bacterium]